MKQVAFITGGTRGIGLGIAKELAKVGFNIAVNGVRGKETVEPVLAELAAYGVTVDYVQGDVSNKQDREKMLGEVLAKSGRLNVLVNNAGIAPKERKDILEASEESFDHLISVNLKGPYFLTQQVANYFVQQKKQDTQFPCCIINISSISATVASVNRGEYCISKAGIAMATKLWASRLGEYNIPVYEVQPGIIKTDMTAGVIEKYDKLFAAGLAIQSRWGLPEDVGKAVKALACGDFPYSTGQVIMVDGGQTIGRL
ncbi:MAG TPA: 3-ketoacyl-ACP reductase [Chitinophagaceae bacterium]|nr:3-ketoacyl-ACP reductase [Chitinophagaceae bacterium]